VASEELDRQVKKEVHAFREALYREGGNGGVICLEFYQKRRLRWPMPAETTPWEVWNIKINTVSLPTEHGWPSKLLNENLIIHLNAQFLL
jgi:autophagy-related protein 101